MRVLPFPMTVVGFGLVGVALAGCPGEAKAPDPTLASSTATVATDTAPAMPTATATAVASVEPTTPPEPPTPRVEPKKADGQIRITNAMPLDSSIDKDKLVSDLNGQASLTPCLAAIRKTDADVGSLNVEMTVGADRKVKAVFRSPLNKDAEKCFLDTMKKWTVTTGGTGKAMVLIVLGDLVF